jgi:hypothetical protein
VTFVRAAVSSRHLRAQPVANQHRRVFGVGRAAEHELSTGHWVISGRDTDLVGAAPLADAGQVLRRLLPACRNGSVDHDNGQLDGRRSSYSISFYQSTLVRGGAPPGTRTPNPLILGPWLWLFVNSADYLRVSRLQTLVVCGSLGLFGCVL